MKHLQYQLPIILLASAVASSHATFFFYLFTMAATDAQVIEYSNTTLFFVEEDLYPGNKMNNLHYTTSPTATSHYPQAISVPSAISSDNFPDVLKHFSIVPNSKAAESMKDAVTKCEMPAFNGETKFCAASVGSIIEFSRATIGSRSIRAIPAAVCKSRTSAAKSQQYTITSSARLGSHNVTDNDGNGDVEDDNLVACHPLSSPNTIFYCHKIKNTKGYRVRMVGSDGTQVETVAMCHADTMGWDRENLAFKLLALRGIHVEPGSTGAICHFVERNGIVWAADN